MFVRMAQIPHLDRYWQCTTSRHNSLSVNIAREFHADVSKEIELSTISCNGPEQVKHIITGKWNVGPPNLS